MSRNIFRNGSKWPKRVALGAGFLAAVAGGSYAYNQLKQDEAQEPTQTVRVSPDVPKRNSDGQLDNALFSDDLTEIVRSPEIPYASVHAKTQELVNRNASPEEPSAQTQDESSFLGLGPAPKTQETLDCALEGDWTWTPELANCETITMETSLAKGQKSLFERGVPQEVVTRNFKEMQDYLVNTGQLDEVIDNIYVENKDGERVWKKAGEDCGDGLNDVWDNTVYTITFSPDMGTWMPNPTNTPQTALDCETCEEPEVVYLEPTPEPVIEPTPEVVSEPEVAQPVKKPTPVVLREADLYCLPENLSHNNEFPRTYTRHSELRQEAKDMGLEAAVGQLSNDWVVYLPTNQSFALMPNQLSGDTMTTYFDLDADGMLESKLTRNIDYDKGQPDKKGTFRRVFKNLHEAQPMSDFDISENQNRFANAVADIRNSPDFANCEYVVEEAPEHVAVKRESQERQVIYEEPRVIHETVRPTTEVRRAHRHDNYCNHNVGHAPVRRGGFFFNASYSKTKIRGYGPTPHFRGGPGFRGGFQGYNRRPVRPFLDVRGSFRHGGPSSSDMLNHRLRSYRGH